MLCPSCLHNSSRVIDSRPSEDNSTIRRRRECTNCGHRFTTYERVIDQPLLIIKSDGSSEAYNRNKLMRGLLIACAKRPISPQQISDLVDNIETTLRDKTKREINSKELGQMVLERLAKLDDVAYVRFASVYKDFQNIDEFVATLEELRHD